MDILDSVDTNWVVTVKLHIKIHSYLSIYYVEKQNMESGSGLMASNFCWNLEFCGILNRICNIMFLSPSA